MRKEEGYIADKQSWLGRPKFALDGVIYRYTVGNEDEESWSRAKQVPSDKIVAHIEGSWMKQIKYRLNGEKVCHHSYFNDTRRDYLDRSWADGVGMEDLD